MKKHYAIDWMIEDNFNFDNKEENVKKDILKNEIENANKINDMNIELIEIENISVPNGSSAIIIKAKGRVRNIIRSKIKI